MDIFVEDGVEVSDEVSCAEVYEAEIKYVEVNVLDNQLVTANVSVEYSIRVEEIKALK